VLARVIFALVLFLAAGMLTAPAAFADHDPSAAHGAPLRFEDVQISPEQPSVGSVATVQFRIETSSGEPVSGLRATGVLRAPSTIEDDAPPPPSLTTIGRELADPGTYEVAVALNQPGRWWIEIRVDDTTGNVARYDHFILVDSVEQPVPATTADPIFIRGDDWNTYYRIDPNTGSVFELEGSDLFKVGDRWWLTDFNVQERGDISSEYGGTWRMSVDIRDAISGNTLTTIQLGDTRANVYGGSQDDPAIATAITIAEDGSAAYIYWARQLGEGWIAHLVEADPLTGDVRNSRVLNGAIASNGFWAEVNVRNDGTLLIAEQVVELASVSGYRLSLLDRGTLDIVEQYRRTDAREEALTHCMLAFPGPVGEIAGEDGLKFSLCSPPEIESDRALVVWDPLTASLQLAIPLDDLINPDPTYTDGIASPDKSTFYAINTRSLQLTEIDLESGETLREANLLPDEDDDPSTLDRFFDWVFGASTDPAQASTSVEPGVAISADGQTLYAIVSPEDREPGILVIDLVRLEIIDSLKTGERVDGIITTDDGRLVVIQRQDNGNGDAITVIEPDGTTRVSFDLPGRSDIVGTRR
jgi:hypothetical protein